MANKNYKYHISTLDGVDLVAVGEKNMKMIARLYEGKKLIFKREPDKK
jgi:hypothetical protein